MAALVKGLPHKQEGQAEDAVMAVETVLVVFRKLHSNLAFLFFRARYAVNFVTCRGESAGYFQQVFFLKACEQGQEGIPSAYAVCFLQFSIKS